MNRTKKICIVSPSLKMGGIERALTVLANYFLKKGYIVFFISAQGGEKFYTLDKGIHFFEPTKKRGNGVFGKISFYFNVISFIRKTVKQINPDVVLSFGDAFNPLVLLALRGTKTPVFISDRTSPDFKFNPIVQFGKKIFYPKSAGFIAQTKRAADYKRNQFGKKLNIQIIPNAIKEMKVYEVPKQNNIVSVGRLSFEKGQDRLIKAFAQIENRKNWKLVFAGTGPMLEELKILAKDLNIEKEVRFLGKVDNVDLLLSESSIFVLPSRREGFPNALCEAMTAGLACVCFDSIPTEELIENGINAIAVKEGDIDQLTNELESLILDENKRKKIAENAIKIKERLNANKIGDLYLNFLFNHSTGTNE